jgi:hypothetical protein
MVPLFLKFPKKKKISTPKEKGGGGRTRKAKTEWGMARSKMERYIPTSRYGLNRIYGNVVARRKCEAQRKTSVTTSPTTSMTTSAIHMQSPHVDHTRARRRPATHIRETPRIVSPGRCVAICGMVTVWLPNR